MFYLSLFTFVFFVAVTMADVKKEYGEFRLSHSDSVQNLAPIPRIYSSRSLYKGYFGFSWCSPLDTKLIITADKITVFDCELGKHLSFTKTKEKGTQKDTQKLTDKEFSNLEKQRWITKTDVYFHYAISDTEFVFSDDGQLSHWTVKGNGPVYVIYKNGKISQLLFNKAHPQIVVLSKDGLILKIGNLLTYDYSQGLLKKVVQNKKIIWRYEYDEFLNMTLWRGVTQSELMKYDSDWDRIVFLKDKNECRFHFQYELKGSRKYILESKKCLNMSPHNALFEVISPRLLVKAPTDTLGKEFRSADSKSGGQNVDTF